MNSRGVTMAELIIVLAVLSIGLGIARIGVSANSARRLNAACNELQADLRYAQRQAVVENRKYQVLFVPAQNKYQMLRHESDIGFYNVIKEKIFDSGVVFESTTAIHSAVTYTARGTTSDACTIKLSNDDYSVELTVNLGSGRVTQKKLTKR